ncbi:MAG: hypothetical protein NT005_02830 [Spirochaetes bacterium]|nr:hypothetical protein [Spirochaetota bacterium]
MDTKEFRRRAKKALDKAMWAVMQSEEASYRAKDAVARCELAEMKASTAYQCSIEAVQILAQEVREIAAGVPIGVESFDKLLEMASEEQRKPFQAYDPADVKVHGPKGAAQAIGVSLPGARA